MNESQKPQKRNNVYNDHSRDPTNFRFRVPPLNVPPTKLKLIWAEVVGNIGKAMKKYCTVRVPPLNMLRVPPLNMLRVPPPQHVEGTLSQHVESTPPLDMWRVHPPPPEVEVNRETCFSEHFDAIWLTVTHSEGF